MVLYEKLFNSVQFKWMNDKKARDWIFLLFLIINKITERPKKLQIVNWLQQLRIDAMQENIVLQF